MSTPTTDARGPGRPKSGMGPPISAADALAKLRCAYPSKATQRAIANTLEAMLRVTEQVAWAYEASLQPAGKPPTIGHELGERARAALRIGTPQGRADIPPGGFRTAGDDTTDYGGVLGADGQVYSDADPGL